MNYAIELNPYDIRTKIYVAWVTWVSRQYDLALKQFESLGDDWGMMCAYREKQMYPEAMAALERWKLGHPSQYRHPQVLATTAGICGLEGRKYEAQKLIDELRKQLGTSMLPVFSSPKLTLASAQKTRRSHGWSGLTKITTKGSCLWPRIRALTVCALSYAFRPCCAACASHPRIKKFPTTRKLV